MGGDANSVLVFPIYVGVDPGQGGGLVALNQAGHLLSAARMPETEADVLAWMKEWTSPTGTAVIERVHSMPRQGVASSFKFGRCYGMLLMGLTAAGVSFAEVSPRVWQKAMGCLSGGDKNVTKRRAQQLFPGVKVTHVIADALLLALYARNVAHAVDSFAPLTLSASFARTSLF